MINICPGKRRLYRISFDKPKSYNDHQRLAVGLTNHFNHDKTIVKGPFKGRPVRRCYEALTSWRMSNLDYYLLYVDNVHTKTETSYLEMIVYPKLFDLCGLTLEDFENKAREIDEDAIVERTWGKKPATNNRRAHLKTTAVITLRNYDEMKAIISFMDKNYPGMWRFSGNKPESRVYSSGLQNQLLSKEAGPVVTRICLYSEETTAEKAAMIMRLKHGV